MNSNVMWEVVCLIRGYQKERTSFVPESGYASLLLGRFVFRKVEASDW